MSSTLTFISQVKYVHNSGVLTRVFDSLSEPVSVTLAGDTFVENAFSVATSTTRVILNCGTGATDDIASFKFLRIDSTQDVMVEFLGGATAANNSNVKVAANRPFYLFSDDTLTYNASGGFAGNASDITKITASNASGSTAVIRIFATT